MNAELDAPPAAPTRSLRTALAIAEAIFSTPEAPMPRERLAWLGESIADMLRRAGARAGFVLRLAMFAISAVAPLFVGRLRPVRSLPLALRIRAIARMEDSVIAAPVLAVKAMLCVVYYDHPDVLASVGVLEFGVPGATGARAPSRPAGARVERRAAS